MNTKSNKKLMELSIKLKKQVIDEVTSGHSYREVAAKYKIGKSTVSNILKNKIFIFNAWENQVLNKRKRKLKHTPNEKINENMWEFVKKCRSKNIPISGPILQTQAKLMATKLGVQNFQASNGWLAAFKKRNDIVFRTLSGESADVNYEVADDWFRKLPDMLKDYAPNNRFNADETGIFYRQLPTKSLVVRGDKCKGGKLAKERISVLFCCSATGEKFKPLVIGQPKRPRPFKQHNIQIENLPVHYYNNTLRHG